MTRFASQLLPVAAIAGTLLTAGAATAQTTIPSYFDAAWRGFDTGYYPEACTAHTMAVADLDGDGDIDVVTGREYHWLPGVSVIKSNGDGTFAPADHYQTGNNLAIGEVKLADFDADGDPDIIATLPDTWHRTNQIGVWRNNGDGTFANRVAFSTLEDGPVGITIADFTGDGFLDVVTANRDYAWAGTTVSLLEHNGQTGALARFLAPVTFEAGVSPTRVDSADLNGDGWPDLAVGLGRNPNAWAAIMINDQNGGFTNTVTYDVGGYAEPFVHLADLDNDGDVDLVTGSYDYTYNSGMLYIQRNDGLANFSAPESYILANAEWPRGLDFADINADGYLDILCAHPNGRRAESWTILMSDGAGGFSGVDRYPCSQNSHAARAVDVDHDGDLDVLSLASFSNALTVHKNDGTGTFPRMVYYDLPYSPSGIDAGDIDLDGDLDLVTAAENIHILRNNGDGTFEEPEGFLSPLNPRDIKLRDLNGDGYVDILVGPEGMHPPYDFGTALNNGDGTFANGVRWSMNACGPGDVDAFDLDNDGDLDVVFAEELACVGQYNGWIYIARNRGNGTFDQLSRMFMPILTRGLEAADLNHDGNLDLMTANAGIGVLLGNGDLTFGDAIITGESFGRFTIADLNGNGETDVTSVTIGNTNELLVHLGNGDGTFQNALMRRNASSTLEPLAVGIDIDARDVDLDGDPDVIVTNYASNDLSLFINNGDGTMQPQQRYGPGINPFESVVADFTGDGTPDIATITYRDNSGVRAVAIVIGTTSAGIPGDADGNGVVDFQDLLAVLAAWGPCAGCPEDLNDDGVVSLADIIVVLANWS